MKTILVATDFSPASLNAAMYGAEMALAIDADLLLLHVYEEPMNFTEMPSSIDSEMLANAEGLMNESKDKLTAQTGGRLRITTDIGRGFFLDTLQDVCERLQPFAVVMGNKGETSSQSVLFGSNTIKAIKNLDWPVVAVPLDAKFRLMVRIGLACDLAEVVNTIPDSKITEFVNDLHAELHIINVGKENVFKPDDVFQAGRLGEMFGPLKPTYHFITATDSDQGIVDLADKLHLDLLIVIPKRHGLIEKITKKSHSKQIVLHSHVPVLTLHQFEK